MRTYRFYKDEYGWFIDLKWFPFNKAHLAMVCGADKLLDILSNNSKEVVLSISTSKFGMKLSDRLERRVKLGLLNGATYEVMSKNVEWERDDLFHLPHDLLSNFLCEKLTRNYVIRNDYGLYEYTVYIFKK